MALALSNKNRWTISVVIQTCVAMIGAIAVLLYVTGRQERLVLAERDNFHSALSSLLADEGIAYWQWDINTDYILWSPYLHVLYGTKGGQVQTYERWLEIVHPDDRERADAICVKAVEHWEPYVMEYRVIGADGRVRHIKERAEFSGDSLMVGICVLIPDPKPERASDRGPSLEFDFPRS